MPYVKLWIICKPSSHVCNDKSTKKDKLNLVMNVWSQLCWSTSLWPIVQAGLKPVFVDVDPNFEYFIK